MRRLSLLAATLAATALTTTACRSAVDALGESAESAKNNAEQLFAAFEYRFDHVERDSAFARSRLKIAREALVPSRLFSDSAVWPIRTDADSSRTVYVYGSYQNGRYRFSGGSAVQRPANVGDQFHVMRLRSLGRGDYEWVTSVDHAIGSVRPAQVGTAIVAALTAAEGRSGAAAIADAAAAFPRTARHLSQLFSLDSLHTAPLAGGATDITLGLTIHADRLRASYPAFSAYVAKYIVPSVYRLSLTDRRGASYFELAGRDGRVIATLRAHRGKLVSRDARSEPLPDTLVLRTDFSAKYRLFRVGYTNLVNDFIIERGDHLRAWTMRFHTEPAWHFPLAVDKLIRSPLRRPFQDRGMELQMGIRDDAGPQTVSFRNARVTVRESAIMRWLGRLGASALADFSGKTEADEHRFLKELFGALRADIGGTDGRRTMGEER